MRLELDAIEASLTLPEHRYETSGVRLEIQLAAWQSLERTGLPDAAN